MQATIAEAMILSREQLNDVTTTGGDYELNANDVDIREEPCHLGRIGTSTGVRIIGLHQTRVVEALR